ncbi:hypothetical protein LTR99_005309 [Exophiala xenobiotica]|uniref:Zn(2)-C6 fungal-type domain-containing protein n=1 Tax=Vermiconidia calcicola TaxID=1690605 RepID=A0AAV9QA29_9PEZI|nr:hypothetical protein LTR41_000254 [Exophiala xenobiotica]KAK5535933.1 hypothetical protein LTR25_005835 [Vermiconidia calcicola]KAK5548874.1 hypothetical protein LTR23_001363 [Chaetothyriales sp. CCFEE 6169]KAK5227178.1 hypothetical protein LTR72_003168 [Exophiala xenobiotica]KAK5241598.1 hypothetical protein LTS06_012011 [Exophiala xenobiotica]
MSGPATPEATRRKRPRAARACQRCRTKKYRCDELEPCSKCKKSNKACIYENAASLRERISSISQSQLVASNQSTGHLGRPEKDGCETLRVDRRPNPCNHDIEGSASNLEGELSEINPHTLNREFHGPTSSLAFLAALQRRVPDESSGPADGRQQSLVSAFHNDTFLPQTMSDAGNPSLRQHRYYFRQSQFFLDAYFRNLHYIHPIIDRGEFLSRCEDLWFERSAKQPQSFVALYFAVMALGALTREWDAASLDGLGRFGWSRKMFEQASLSMGSSPFKTDIETVQASIIMAKVCQNELNPHLAYMYLGIAVRTSLSAGHNRHSQAVHGSVSPPTENLSVSKTWWGLYSLEIETSFALGRPDSLGPDLYHNRAMPAIDDTETGIITPMVEFARIVREVSRFVFLPARSISQRIQRADEIEEEMEQWVNSLPDMIRPQLHNLSDSLGTMTDAHWAKKQRHTLKFRYFNVKMVLFRPFLLHAARTQRSSMGGAAELDQPVSKCVSAARNTITFMHHMYCSATYFRTWWYNLNYTLYAATIIVGYLTKLATEIERSELLGLISMSIEILNAMDEHVVAKKASAILQQASAQMQHPEENINQEPSQQVGNAGPGSRILNGRSTGAATRASESPAPDLFLDSFGDVNLDFMSQLFPWDDDNSSLCAI